MPSHPSSATPVSFWQAHSRRFCRAICQAPCRKSYCCLNSSFLALCRRYRLESLSGDMLLALTNLHFRLLRLPSARPHHLPVTPLPTVRRLGPPAFQLALHVNQASPLGPPAGDPCCPAFEPGIRHNLPLAVPVDDPLAVPRARPDCQPLR